MERERNSPGVLSERERDVRKLAVWQEGKENCAS